MAFVHALAPALPYALRSGLFPQRRSGASPAAPTSTRPVTGDTLAPAKWAGDHVVATVDREALVAVQTPQAFDAAALRAVHAAGDEATDDAGLLEAAGLAVDDDAAGLDQLVGTAARCDTRTRQPGVQTHGA